MQNTKLVKSLGKLAVAGEQAGLTKKQLVHLLNDGLAIETLLELIT